MKLPDKENLFPISHESFLILKKSIASELNEESSKVLYDFIETCGIDPKKEMRHYKINEYKLCDYVRLQTWVILDAMLQNNLIRFK